MKVNVIKPFRDKHTKVVYQKGQEIEVTNERYEEINSTAHGVLVKPVEVKAKPKGKK
ncbi:hypothetical protein DFR55_101360 [Herbinix hemicellulosilytica]|uniref:Uncharacterized protein n=1 Tax=Herbinix hemicellulosilytica TaxID=1564487 RepID=A0A0H5SGL3_HERHM|nr:hypothetical protein [Herbinix hemicellulosilytica]RBP60899.1 hypothetical protein DFR55_101360 [Herbinix hemicellulosilytica]CRZ34594.1 hypothetical protein HHT355_1393 [Herbinix hemicellulosilytica]